MEMLELTIGDAGAIAFPVVDRNGNAVSLGSAASAKFTVREYAGASTALLDLTATIDVPSSRVSVQPTQPQADALVAGDYLGQVAIQFGSVWRKSDLFTVRVAAAVAT